MIDANELIGFFVAPFERLISHQGGLYWLYLVTAAGIALIIYLTPGRAPGPPSLRVSLAFLSRANLPARFVEARLQIFSAQYAPVRRLPRTAAIELVDRRARHRQRARRLVRHTRGADARRRHSADRGDSRGAGRRRLRILLFPTICCTKCRCCGSSANSPLGRSAESDHGLPVQSRRSGARRRLDGRDDRPGAWRIGLRLRRLDRPRHRGPHERLRVRVRCAGAHLRHSHIWLSYGPHLEGMFVSPAMHQIHWQLRGATSEQEPRRSVLDLG